MPSTFFGLNIGASALSAFQASVTTTANNVSNVKTKGYSRQTATLAATDPIRVTAKYGSVGTGVEVTQISQERNVFYDKKYWESLCKHGLYDKKLYYANQVQELLKDDKTINGFSSIFNTMFDNLDDISKSNTDTTVRNQFINQAQSLCTYFNNLSTSLTSIQEDCNEEVKSYVDNINNIAQKISIINKEINQIEMNGGRANELRDERAVLIDELAKIGSVSTLETKIINTNDPDVYLGGTNYMVKINGQVLVDGNDYRELECVPRKYKLNQTDAEGLYDIVWKDLGTDFSVTTVNASGELKALMLERDGNNCENLKGNVSSNGVVRDDANHVTKITLENLSQDSINDFFMDKSGVLNISNIKYSYSGWSAEVEDGKVKTITFNIPDEKKTITTTDPSGNEVTSEEYVPQLLATDAEAVDMMNLNAKAVNGLSVETFGIPYYQQQATEFVRTFTSMFNAMELEGVDLDGNAAGTFFAASLSVDSNSICSSDKVNKEGVYADGVYTSDDYTYYNMTIANMKVHDEYIKNPRRFATTDKIVDGPDRQEVVIELKRLQSDITLFRGEKGSAFLETILSDAAIEAQKTEVFNLNYMNLSNSIDIQRQSISGVDEDEEALNLIKFQNAYNLAAKVISVMAEIYNKLINETGVV